MTKRMPDGHPTDEFLDWIRAYDVLRNGPCKLIRTLQAEWKYPEYIRWHPKTRTLKISTGGWSGHESIMGALAENRMFFPMYWRATVRGGHYTFRIRKIEEIGRASCRERV